MVAVRAIRAVHDTVGLAVGVAIGVAIGLTVGHRAHVVGGGDSYGMLFVP